MLNTRSCDDQETDDAVLDCLAQLTSRVNEQLDQLYPVLPRQDVAEALLGADSSWRTAPADVRAQVAARCHSGMIAPMRWLIDRGGQRWRPGLMLQTMDVLGADGHRLSPLAAAMEMTHAGSLVVDDIEDHSPMRRGHPSVHEQYGTPAALNAGTAAYFALSTALTHCLPEETGLRGTALDVYMTALLAAHTGQSLDIQGHAPQMDAAVASGDNRHLLQTLRLTYRLKSGAVEGTCLQIAALASGAAPAVQLALKEYGTAMGCAYQISDDVSDLTGVQRAGRATKQPGEDLRNGKVTMPLAHAVTLLSRPARRYLWEAVRHGGADSATVRQVTDELAACGAVAACADQARDSLRAAWRQLQPLLPASPATDMLHAIVQYVINRNLPQPTSPPPISSR